MTDELADLRERNARFTLLKAIVDQATEELGNLRTAHLETLLQANKVTGGKTFVVSLPGDDVPVAELRMSGPKERTDVTDPDVLLKWLQANHPAAVDVETIPAEEGYTRPAEWVPPVEEQKVYTVNPKRWSELQKQFKVEAEGIVDTATGVMVDGVKHVPAGELKSFSVNYLGQGQQMLFDAYRSGDLNQLVAGTTLAPIAQPAPMIERHLEIVEQPTHLRGMLVRRCSGCGGQAAKLSGSDLCPSCEAKAYGTVPVDPGARDAERCDLPGAPAVGLQRCDRCGDDVAVLSSAGLCDRCEAERPVAVTRAAMAEPAAEPFDPGTW